MQDQNAIPNTTQYRDQVAAIAADITALAAMLRQPLAVRAEHAALVWTVEQVGGTVDLLTGDIDWTAAATRWEVKS